MQMGKTAFGEKVRAAREARGLTLQALAELTGVRQSTLWRIESGATENPRNKRRIEEALGITPRDGDAGMSVRSGRSASGPGETGDSRAMGQLVGAMQMAAGGGEDPYMTLLEVATKNDDPPAVFKALAALRGSAPAGASHAWWFLKYQDMGGGAKRKQRS